MTLGYNYAVKHRKFSISIGGFLKWVLLIVMSVFIVFPFLIVLFNSFKTPQEYIQTSVFSFPKEFYLGNYKTVFVQGNILNGFINSAIFIVVACATNCLLGTLAAYALGRFDFKLKKLVTWIYMLALFIPTTTTQVVVFSIIRKLGLFNTYFAGFLLYAGTNIVQINIYRQQLDEIPYSLDEAAMIDGASYFKIYRIIILPLLKPAIVTAVIINLVSVYSDLFSIYLYMPSIKTVTYVLYSFAVENSTQWTVMSAAIVLALIPSLIVYFTCQKMLYAGLVDGSVK